MKRTTQTEQKTNTYSTGTIIFIYISAIILRYSLMITKYQQTIANHIEISTPLNSWKRVLEGLYLQSIGVNPYDGDLLHEPPISLEFYRALLKHIRTEAIFIGFDIMTAILIHFIGRQYMFKMFIKQEKNLETYAKDCGEYLLVGSDFANAPIYAVIAYLFNPYTVLNCVGFATTTFQNFFIAVCLFSMFYGNIPVCMLSLAVCTMISFYPIILIVPISLYFLTIYKSRFFLAISVIIFGINLGILKYISTIISNGDDYLRNVYGFILSVPDLQPNIGLFWYFFTEMFDHFRDLFIYSFQINVTILYLVPLSIKFRKDPFLLSTALLFLIAIFKSYPCVGDIGFVLGLLPCFIHLFSCSQQGFLVGVIYLITSVLGPILWHLWIYSNSANANFYFGVTLAFAIGQIFFVTDILFSYLKHEFCLKYGKGRKIEGHEALLVLE